MIKKINCPKLILVSAVISMSLNCHERSVCRLATGYRDSWLPSTHEKTRLQNWIRGETYPNLDHIRFNRCFLGWGAWKLSATWAHRFLQCGSAPHSFFSTKIVGLKLESFISHAYLPSINTSYSLIVSLVIQSTTVEWTSQPTKFFATSHQVASNWPRLETCILKYFLGHNFKIKKSSIQGN